MQQQLVDITHSIQQCFDPGTAQFNSLGAYSKKLNQKREKWPDKIYQTWQNRKVPVYSPESITKCNTARVSQIEFANEQCKCLEDAFLTDIQRVKKKIPLTPMGVLAPGSAHARPSAQPPIDVSGNFPPRVSAESPYNISPNPL